MSLLIYILSAVVINLIEVYSYYVISGEKLDVKNKKIYLIYCFQTILIILNYTFVDNIIKVLITFLIMAFMCKILFKNKKFIECICIVFVVEIFIILSEFIFMFCMSMVKEINNAELIQIMQGEILTNLIISMIFLLILFSTIPNKLYQLIFKFTDNISVNKMVIYVSLPIVVITFIFYLSYYNLNDYITLFVNIFVSLIYIIIIFLVINNESKYNKIHSKYIATISELEDYEKLINEYRVINHENKNQLNCIKGMTNNKKVHSYINEIMENKQSENKEILNQALLIPTGGLRGLLYSKMVVMKNKNISYRLYVDKKINSKLIKNISSKTILDICQIIGVFIDNAIEAVENCDNKMIIVNIYKLGDIVIEIINNFTEEFDINKIDKLGYTTKNGMHGYGLSLVNKILKANSDLLNERTIKDKMFKQKLIIKK